MVGLRLVPAIATKIKQPLVRDVLRGEIGEVWAVQAIGVLLESNTAQWFGGVIVVVFKRSWHLLLGVLE